MYYILSFILLFSMSVTEQIKVASAYIERGQPKKAIALLDEALTKSSELEKKTHAKALESRAIAYLQLEQPDQAAENLESSLRLTPGAERSWLLLGMSYDLASKPALVSDSYQRALTQLPKSAELHRALGMMLFEQGDIKGALTYLEEAVRYSHRDPDFMMDYAYLKLRTGSYTDARDLAMEALSKGPDAAPLYQILGDAHAALKSTSKAERAYQKAIQLKPSSFQAHFHLALLYNSNDKVTEARDAFAKALKIDPKNPKARALYGLTLARLGDDQKARPYLEEALKLDAGFEKGRNALIKIYERANLMQKANALRK